MKIYRFGNIIPTVGLRFRHYINIYVCVTTCVRSHRHGNVILCWFYNYTGSCRSIGWRNEIRNLHRWGLITLTYHLCIVQSIMGRHHYTSWISHIIVSRFKVQVQQVQMAHTLNSKQNGGYEFRVQILPLRLCTRPKFNCRLTHCPAYPIVVIGWERVSQT